MEEERMGDVEMSLVFEDFRLFRRKLPSDEDVRALLRMRIDLALREVMTDLVGVRSVDRCAWFERARFRVVFWLAPDTALAEGCEAEVLCNDQLVAKTRVILSV